MDIGSDIGIIIEEQVKDIMAFILVGPNDLCANGNMVGNIGERGNAFGQTEIFRGVTGYDRRDLGIVLLPVTTGMDHVRS